MSLAGFHQVSNCPICSSEKLVRKFSGVPAVDYTTDISINLLECVSCSHALTNPRPDEGLIPSLYTSRESSDFPNTNPLARFLRRVSIVGRLRKIRVYDSLTKNSAQILDFGCGDAIASQAVADARRANLTCVDFHHQPPPTFNQDSSHFKYLTYSSSEWKLADTYDMVLSRHVFEHLSDPRFTLSLLAHVVKSGGFLVIEVPNFDCIWRNVFGKYWWALYVPRHLSHFTSRSLSVLVENLSGFQTHSFVNSSTPLMGGSLGQLFRQPVSNLSLVGLILFPIQLLIEKLSGKGSTLIIALKKL